MRATLPVALAAVLALAPAERAGAQDDVPRNLPAPVPVDSAPQPAPLPAPGDILILEASERLAGLHDPAKPLDPAGELCLEESETILLASERTVFALSGPGCFRPAEAEEQATLEEISLSRPAPQPERGPGGAERPRTAAMPSARPRIRAGAVRGAPRPAPLPVVFRVSATSAGLAPRFPVGTLLVRGAQVCLKQGEQISVAGSNGQQATYRGPGCMRRNAPPSRTNIGGFTFG